jgi:[ribosomal protein S5]-alanine N-acetyltransferase
MELRTERLVLREFLPSDAAQLAAYQSDPRYLEHYDHSAAITDAHALVELFRQWAEDSPRTKYQLAIVLDGRVIGTCGVRRAAAGDDEAELGCELDPEYWNAGYAREAAQAMLDYGFRTLGLQRIVARTLASNDRAISLALSLGFREVAGGLFVMDRS